MPDGTTRKGYLRTDFEDAWSRYPSEKGNSVNKSPEPHYVHVDAVNLSGDQKSFEDGMLTDVQSGSSTSTPRGAVVVNVVASDRDNRRRQQRDTFSLILRTHGLVMCRLAVTSVTKALRLITTA